MGVRWWGCAKDVILKGIEASNELGSGQEHGSEDPPLQKLGRELNAESADEERGEAGSGGGRRGFRERTIENGSRGSYRLSIETSIY
jgi:hypothetical protein